MADKETRFRFLLYSRALRSAALIYMTLAAPLYLSQIGIRIPIIGLIYVGVMLFMVFVTLSLGMLGDRFGYKKAMMLSELLPIIGGLALGLSSNTDLIAVAVIVGGVGGVAGGLRGVFGPGTTALIASNYRDDGERVNRMSRLSAVSSIFSIVGALVLISQSYLQALVGQLEAYRYLFLLAAALLFLSFISIIFVVEEERPRKSTRIMKRKSMLYSLRVVVINAINGASLGIALPLLPLLLASAFSIPAQSVSFMIGLVYIPSYMGVALGSYLAKRSSYRSKILNVAELTRLSSGALLILMGLFIALQYLHATAGYLILAAVTGLYAIRSIVAGFGNPSIQAVNMKGISEEDYGTASSLQGIASNAAMTSSGISGYLIEYSLPMPLLIGGLLQVIAGFLYKPLLGKSERQKKQGLLATTEPS